MARGDVKLMYPGLAGIYKQWSPIAYTIVRVVVGVMFLMHVSGKFHAGAPAVAANIMAKNGLEPSLAFAYATMVFESVGGVCMVIGLFTRPVAAILTIEMLIALFAVHFAKGYAAGGGGYEYVLLIAAVCFAIALRGGGPYSADAAIGKEV